MNEPGDGRAERIALAVAVILALLPIALANILPLGDYPNHLARFHILSRYGAEEWMRQFWIVRWEPLANLGADLLAVGLAKILPILLAGRVAVAIITLLHGFGFRYLARQWSGRYTVWGLLGFPLVYSFPHNMGFLNFQLGLGLMLWGLGAHLALRERPFGSYALVMVPLALVTMLAHLQAFGLMLVVITVLELGFLVFRERPPLAPGLRGVGAAALRVAALIPLPLVYFLLGSGKGELGGILWSNRAKKISYLTKLLYVGDLRHDLIVTAGLFVMIAVAFAAES